MALLIKCLLLIVVTLNVSNCESTERLSTEEAKRLIVPLFSNEDGAFCPGADICRTERSKLLETRKNFDGIACCTDCSCDDDCVFYNDCCFPPNGSLHFDQDEECVKAVSIQVPLRLFLSQPAFYMVTSCQKPSVDTFNMTSCWEFKDASPWGPMFPIYSKSTHKLYLNQPCAWCNNVFDGVLLNPSFSCVQTRQTDISTLTNVMEGFLSNANNCFVYFSEKHATYSYLISKKRCLISKQMMKNCLRPDIHENLSNFSEQTVNYFCESDFYSPAFNAWGVFKNVFCMMCLRFYDSNCQNQGVRDPTNALDFTVMIDGLWFKTYNEVDDKPPHLACRVLPNKTLDTDNCRHVHCPNSQYRSTSGECVIPTGIWSTNGLVLFLNLTPTETIEITEEAGFEILIPLKHDWKIQRVFYTAKAENYGIQVVGSIVLELTYGLIKEKMHVDEENFNDLLQDIDRSLNIQWNILIFQKQSLYRVGFMPYRSSRLFEYSLGKWFFGINKLFFENGLIDFSANNSIIFNAVKETSFLLDETFVYFSKLFFCHRIEFSGEEIKLSIDTLHLYVSEFDVILDELSFVFCQSPKSSDILCAKVCIDDVPFELFTNGLAKNYIVNKAVTCTYLVFILVTLF